MKIFLKIFLLTFSCNVWSRCDFRSDVKKVFSLSGSGTVVLKELGLLHHEKVAGISIFNPVDTKAFKGKIFPGGVFLSNSSIEEFKDGVVFYDESREVGRLLRSRTGITSREVKTRTLLPLAAFATTADVLGEFLTGCENDVLVLKTKVEGIQKKLLEKIPKGLQVVFFLGDFRNNRPPETVIVNDGVVKLLKEQDKITTYPSDLAYLNWSSKILRGLPEKTLYVGIVDSGMKREKEIKRSSQRMTLIYPGSLVPGLSQLEAFLFWADSL